ncbi:MAG: extracellular solute-binding protein [Candidatus Cloacimonetes bacterium]|nr:extracellular solute-binding protein [Candidatus Cloacimonadota bacterium]
MRNRYGFVIFLLLILLFPIILFCEESVVLKVFSLPDPKATDAFSRADMEVIKAFQEKYPWIELRSFSGIKIENMELDAGPLMAIAGGVSPDIIYVNFRQSDTYIQNDFLYPLDEFMIQEDEQLLDYRVEKPVWQVIKRKKQDEKEEKVWCLPYETLVRVMMYRKDLFHRVGLDPNSPPENWDELLEFSRQLTMPSEGRYGLFLASGPEMAYDWITYLWSAGGDAVLQNPGTEEWYASFNSDAGVDAMEFYLKMITTPWIDAAGNKQEGFVIREGDWGRLWDEGKIGMRMMYMDQRNLGGQTDPNLYGVAPPPKGPGGLRGSELNCRMMGIFSGAGESNNAGIGDRNPEKVRDAAWKYIWFYDSEEARQIRMRVMIEAGYGRMQNPVYLKRYGYEEYLKYSPPGWIETFEEALANGKPEPFGHNCQKIYYYMSYPIDTIIQLEREGKLGDTPEQKRSEIRRILDQGAERTNEKMIGKIPEDVRRKRNSIAFLVAIFIFLAFIVSLVRVWQIFTPENRSFTRTGLRKKSYFWAWMMLIPALGSILLWKYLPMIMGSAMAFQDYRIVGDSSFIGFQNFADVLFDPVWWSSLGRTLYYMILSLGLGFCPPIILAILLQEVSRGKILYRIIYYLPAVISGVIVIYLWKLLYDPSDAGGFNQILMMLGLEKSRWIQDEKLAMLCTILPSVWAGVGPGCLIYLAALKGIPEENYEAADIDGASFLHKIRYIVIPNLKALIIIQFIAAFIAASQQSGFILVMTFGGPNEATRVADLLIFEKAYLYLKFGVATTMAWMLGMMMMGFTVLQLKRLSKMEFRTASAAEEK